MKAPAIPGVATALAVTPKGGVTTRVECLLLSGRGRLIITGNLVGEAKDSCQVALSLARSKAWSLGIDPAEFLRTDVHFHIPEGLPSKDGPSAGLAMFMALVSALIRKPIDPAIAFTGEISLFGKVEGINGLKEKSMAAIKAGITRIYAPTDNASEFVMSAKKRDSGFEILAVDHVDIVLARVFEKEKTRKKSPLRA